MFSPEEVEFLVELIDEYINKNPMSLIEERWYLDLIRRIEDLETH